MNLITIIVLILLLVYLLKNNISLSTIFKQNNKEDFLVSIKDKQKVGFSYNDENSSQPKSSWKGGNVNYESCYSTETRNGNSTPRHGNFFCNQGIDGGEAIPANGLYSLEMSNYTIHPGKLIRGKPLTGTFNRPGGRSYTLNENGLVNGEVALTLEQSKSFCDSLKDKCKGFIMGIPTKGTPIHSRTIFFSSIDDGWEDPDTYSKMQGIDYTDTQYVSYIKKDVNATEKPVLQGKINEISAKYINLPTCNWKSANRCIFKDYTYNQGNGTCISKDNLSYNIDQLRGYDQNRLTEWLKELHNSDRGPNKLSSEATNVFNYIERCKDVEGYEFLSNTGLSNPYIPTKQPGDVKGRYVRITINNRDVYQNWLQLAEVQVISNNRNIAFGKSSNSSGNYPGSTNSKANDGNNDGNWSNGSVYHSNNGHFDNSNDVGGPQFWEVDLGDESQTIDRIIISNRSDCCKERLNNWLLSIYDYNKNLKWARIYPNHPNPKVTIDIKASDNDMNNIKIKDYNKSRFNRFFYRVSNTEYNSKQGWTNQCAEECHKNVCEGENKKWIGNNNWYGCREYKPGEKEAEDAEKKRRLQEQLKNSIIVYEHGNYQGRSLTLGIGTHDYNYLNSQGFNDIISSLKVPPGLSAQCWEHNPGQGRQWTFTSDTPWVGNAANDTISSIRVYHTPKTPPTVKFSARFISGRAPSIRVENAWTNFRKRLTGNYDTMEIGNNLGAHIKVTDNKVNQLAKALREATHGFRIDIGGKTWRVLRGCVAWPRVNIIPQQNQVYLTSDPWDCSCSNAWTIRPMIANPNWGGLNSGSCGQRTQTITVQFSNSRG